MPDHPPPAPAQEGSSLGPLRHLGLRRSVDGHSRRQYRDLDAERSGVFVDDRPRFQPADGGAGPGGDHIADVCVRAARRRPGDIVDRRRLLLVIQVADEDEHDEAHALLTTAEPRLRTTVVASADDAAEGFQGFGDVA
jgi:hypothetical protein